jgi:chemotaxis signal transduction protein
LGVRGELLHTQAKTNSPGGLPQGGRPALTPEEGKQYLVFKEGIFTLALKLPAIKKLYDAESFPPRTPGTRLLDLHDLMGAEFVARHGYWIELEAGSNRYLMPVEDVEGIRELSLAVVMAYPPVLRRPELDYIRSIFFDGLRMIVELDAEVMARTADGLGGGPEGSTGPLPDRGRRPGQAKKAAAGAARTMVLFEGAGGLWSLDLDLVVQIVIKDEIHPVPASGRGIMGVAYYAEQAVPVIAPSVWREIMLGEKGGTGDDFSTVLVAETPRGPLGFGCDHVVRVEKEAAEREPGGSGPRELDLDKVLEFLA